MKQLLKYILSQMQEHQKLAETKHSISIALISGIAVVIINFVVSPVLLIKITSIVALGFCLIALVFSFLAVSSKLIILNEKEKKKEIVNYIYFNDIKTFSPLQYLDEISKAYDFPKGYTPDSFEIDLAKSILTTAQRTSTKYRLFNISLRFLFVSLGIMFFNGFWSGFDGILF